MKRNCIECDSTFTGRNGKKYCSNQCRATYFNKQNADANNFVRRINKILRNNRKILKTLNPNAKTRVHRDTLIAAGFKFKYFTNAFETKSTKYFFCYEFGYRISGKGYYMLVENKKYVH